MNYLLKWVLKSKELIGGSVEYTAWSGDEMKLSWLELAELYFLFIYAWLSRQYNI